MKKLIMFLLVVVNLFALSSSEKSALIYMYQEEKLAKDVYSTLAQMYPEVSAFSHIYNAEVKHERAVANVLEHYGIPLPVRGDEVGVFADEKLQSLYNDLISKGEKSRTDAIEVGIMVEVTDVEDLDKYLQEATSPDVIALFKFLRAGSYNHYNAFNRALEMYTGKDACELMSSEWCKDYPFEKGIGREYANWYWFSGLSGSSRGGFYHRGGGYGRGHGGGAWR